MGLKADEFIPESQMLSSTRKFAQLGNLYQSLVSRVILPALFLGTSASSEADVLFPP
jgi:hypothetical protein